MALDTTKFHRISAGPGPKLFVYSSADAEGTMAGAGYFLNADIQPMISVDDVIVAIDTNLNTVGFLVVTASSSTALTTAVGNT